MTKPPGMANSKAVVIAFRKPRTRGAILCSLVTRSGSIVHCERGSYSRREIMNGHLGLDSVDAAESPAAEECQMAESG